MSERLPAAGRPLVARIALMKPAASRGSSYRSSREVRNLGIIYAGAVPGFFLQAAGC